MLTTIESVVAGVLLAAQFAYAIEIYPVGDVRNCLSSPRDPVSQPLYSLDVLPGLGYDALRDTDMGPVLNFNYSLCQVSKDRIYLLPDNVYLFPLRQSNVEQYAEFFDHWDQITSLTSRTISAHASGGWSFAKVSASFSYEHSTTKSRMVNDDSSVVRVHLRNTLYTVHAEPRSPLHPDFKSRLFEIAADLERNLTDHARYLAELVIRDYGTHYLSSVKAGAVIAQTDFLKKEFTEDKSSDSSTIKASASASFYNKFSVGFGYSNVNGHTSDESYLNSRTFSKIDTYGGPPFRINYTIDHWEDGVLGALVPIDRSGDPLHFAINLNTIPELPDATREAVKDIVYEASNRYFRVNTHTGCTNPQSKHFDFNANVDDNSCDTQANLFSNYTFGGIYQLCIGDQSLCQQYAVIDQPNPLTHGYSCPDNTNYIPVKLFSGSIDIEFDKSFVLFSIPIEESARYETYWCAAKPGADIPADSGFLFGGFYTKSRPNPVTNTMSCPQYYVPLKIGNYMNMCVSRDFELGFKYSIPFGGFETCLTGNPQAKATFNDDPNSWPHECPNGYTRYFGGVEHGCDINICVRNGAFVSRKFNQALPPRLPPFHAARLQGDVNDTESLKFTGSDGNVWTRSWSGEWSVVEPPAQCFIDKTTTEQEFTVETTSSVYTTSDATTAEETTVTVTEATTAQPMNVPLQASSGVSVVAIALPTILISVLLVCVIAGVVIIVAWRVHKRNHVAKVDDHSSDLDDKTPA